MLTYSIHWKFIKTTKTKYFEHLPPFTVPVILTRSAIFHFPLRSHHLKRLVREVCDEHQPETGASEGHRRDGASAVPGERFQTYPH